MNSVVLGKSSQLAQTLNHTWAEDCYEHDHCFDDYDGQDGDEDGEGWLCDEIRELHFVTQLSCKKI